MTTDPTARRFSTRIFLSGGIWIIAGETRWTRYNGAAPTMELFRSYWNIW